MNIVLIGYMGSGKTSVGKKLAKKLNMMFLDLDEQIERNENMKISELFKTKGEIYFRKLETIQLQTLLSGKNNFVLAVGGGTPCYANNMALINNYAQSFYLKASLKTIYDKLIKVNNKNKRPLIADISDDDLTEFIAKHLFERMPYYEKAGQIINIDNKSKEQIIEAISSGMQ
jgi:shikimate kinase